LFLAHHLRAAALGALLAAVFLFAGCAQPVRTSTTGAEKTWAGRISMQVQSEPAQSFSAGFELKGQAERGELALTSPLGNVLGILRWAPGEALLDSGNGSVQRFYSIDQLMVQATGAALPLPALFAWLAGDNATAAGWSVDLSRQSEGRLTAKRTQPLPVVDLRVALDR